MLPTDLPADLTDFLARFGTDAACRDHLFALRWPGGFRCPDCSHGHCYRLETRIVYECVRCRGQHSLLAGTIFEQTKTGLSKWFLAIYWFASSKGGISALELKRHLGFKSDQTALSWLHKLRSAMGPDGTRLAAPVEVGAAPAGRPASGPGAPGRGALGEACLAGAVERRHREVKAPDPAALSGKARTLAEGVVARLAEGRGLRRGCLGRTRLGVIDDTKAEAWESFIKDVIGPASPGAAGRGLGGRGLGGRRSDAEGDPRAGIVLANTVRGAAQRLPSMPLVFTLLRRLIIGTYHGGVSLRHLPRYLDEFAFRFNRRTLSPVARAASLIERALASPPLPNRMIFAGSNGSP